MQGTKAFCSGGDQSLRGKEGYVDYDNFGRLNVLDLQVRVLLIKASINTMFRSETSHLCAECRSKSAVFLSQL